MADIRSHAEGRDLMQRNETTYIRVRRDLLERLRDAAHEQRTNMTALLSRILEESLPAYERKN